METRSKDHGENSDMNGVQFRMGFEVYLDTLLVMDQMGTTNYLNFPKDTVYSWVTKEELSLDCNGQADI